MIKSLLLAGFALGTFALSPSAEARPSTTQMTCVQARGLVQRYVAIVLGTGGDTYDRFVSNIYFCSPGQTIRAAFVPTRDTNACFVGYTCIFDVGT